MDRAWLPLRDGVAAPLLQLLRHAGRTQADVL